MGECVRFGDENATVRDDAQYMKKMSLESE